MDANNNLPNQPLGGQNFLYLMYKLLFSVAMAVSSITAFLCNHLTELISLITISIIFTCMILLYPVMRFARVGIARRNTYTARADLHILRRALFIEVVVGAGFDNYSIRYQ